jgi:hypothetical protein
MDEEPKTGFRKWVNLLLLVPCIAALWVPIYNFDAPRFFGIPFFYFWQLAWIWIGAGITWIVYAVGWKVRDR